MSAMKISARGIAKADWRRAAPVELAAIDRRRKAAEKAMKAAEKALAAAARNSGKRQSPKRSPKEQKN